MPVVQAKAYLEYRNEGYWVADTRISLDSIVYAFRNGLPPEIILQSFPIDVICGSCLLGAGR